MMKHTATIGLGILLAGCMAGGSGGSGSGGSGGSGSGGSGSGGSGSGGSGVQGQSLFGAATGQWEAMLTGGGFGAARVDIGTGTQPRTIIASVDWAEVDQSWQCDGKRYAVLDFSEGGQTGRGAIFAEYDCNDQGWTWAESRLITNVSLQRTNDAQTDYGVLGGVWEALADDGRRCRLVAQEGMFRAECEAATWVGTFGAGMFAGSTNEGIEGAAQRVSAAAAGPRINASDYGPMVGAWTMQFSNGIESDTGPSLNLRMDGGRLTAAARWRTMVYGCDGNVTLNVGVDVAVDGGGVSGDFWAEGPTDCDSNRTVRVSMPISGARSETASSDYGAVGGAWRVNVDGVGCSVGVGGDGFTAQCDNGRSYEGHGSGALFTVKNNGYFELAAFRSGD